MLQNQLQIMSLSLRYSISITVWVYCALYQGSFSANRLCRGRVTGTQPSDRCLCVVKRPRTGPRSPLTIPTMVRLSMRFPALDPTQACSAAATTQFDTVGS